MLYKLVQVILNCSLEFSKIVNGQLLVAILHICAAAAVMLMQNLYFSDRIRKLFSRV